jgi:hypothetical protein
VTAAGQDCHAGCYGSTQRLRKFRVGLSVGPKSTGVGALNDEEDGGLIPPLENADQCLQVTAPAFGWRIGKAGYSFLYQRDRFGLDPKSPGGAGQAKVDPTFAQRDFGLEVGVVFKVG